MAATTEENITTNLSETTNDSTKTSDSDTSTIYSSANTKDSFTFEVLYDSLPATSRKPAKPGPKCTTRPSATPSAASRGRDASMNGCPERIRPLEPVGRPNELTCTSCDYTIVWNNSTTESVVKYWGAKSLRCQFCDTPFFNIDDFWCPICDYATKDLTSLYLHYRMHYYVSCVQCGETFGSIALLREHERKLNRITKYLTDGDCHRSGQDCRRMHCGIERRQVSELENSTYNSILQKAEDDLADGLREVRMIRRFIDRVYRFKRPSKNEVVQRTLDLLSEDDWE